MPRRRIENTHGKHDREARGENTESRDGSKILQTFRVCRLLLNRRVRSAELLWKTNYTSLNFSQTHLSRKTGTDEQALVPGMLERGKIEQQGSTLCTAEKERI